jgi:RsiW-degrading membrane proteinase PrsW (M82 family)
MGQRLKLLKLLILACGLTLIGVGVACLLLYILLPLSDGGPDLLATNLTIASLGAITVTLGFALARQARASLRGRPSGEFRPPSPWLLGLLFVFCLLVGQGLVSFAGGSTAAALLFPPLHIVAAVCPALAILAFVARRTRAVSWRSASLEVAHGALLAPMAALAAELIVILALVLVVSLVVIFTPGGAARLMELSANLQDPAWVENAENLTQLVLSPAALILIVLVFVVVAPLIEEFLKALGVLLLGYRLRGRAEAWVWGVACGAGFALTESLFNGSLALEGWAAVMLMRLGASLMHCVASGMMGLGWHDALASRRPWRLLAAYAGSTGIHALWNAAAVGVAVPSLLMVSTPEDVLVQGVAGLAVLGCLGFLFLLTLSMIVLLAYLTRTVRPTGAESLALDQQQTWHRDLADDNLGPRPDETTLSEEGE